MSQNLKTSIFWFGFICFLIISSVLASYIINFRNIPISDQTSDWGSFGDYFGGILNPLIGLINLAALIYIAYIVEKAEAKRNDDSLDAQRVIALIAIRQKAVLDFSSMMDKVHMNLTDWEGYENTMTAIPAQLHSFVLSYHHLFPKLADHDLTPINNSLKEIIQSHNSFRKALYIPFSSDQRVLNPNRADAEKRLLEESITKFSPLRGEIQKTLMDGFYS